MQSYTEFLDFHLPEIKNVIFVGALGLALGITYA